MKSVDVYSRLSISNEIFEKTKKKKDLKICPTLIVSNKYKRNVSFEIMKTYWNWIKFYLTTACSSKGSLKGTRRYSSGSSGVFFVEETISWTWVFTASISTAIDSVVSTTTAKTVPGFRPQSLKGELVFDLFGFNKVERFYDNL